MTSLTFTTRLPQMTEGQAYLNMIHAPLDNIKSSNPMDKDTWIGLGKRNGFSHCIIMSEDGLILMSANGAPMQVPFKDAHSSLSAITAYTPTAADTANAEKALGPDGVNVKKVYRIEFKKDFVQQEDGSSASTEENEYLDIIVVKKGSEIAKGQFTGNMGYLSAHLSSLGSDHLANQERHVELWLLTRLIMWHMVQPCNWSEGAKQFGVWDLESDQGKSRMKTLATAKANTDSTTDAKLYINDFLINSGKMFLFERNGGVKRRYDLPSFLSAIATVIDNEKIKYRLPTDTLCPTTSKSGSKNDGLLAMDLAGYMYCPGMHW